MPGFRRVTVPARIQGVLKGRRIMILVTRINKVDQFYVNEDLIEFIEETPDTILALNTGKKLVVMESAEEIVTRIREEKSRIYGVKQFFK